MAEIRPLTGLRGVAAVTVFLAHMRETLGDHGFHFELPDPVVRLFLSGGRQVDIFFVLSGFILTMNYREWFAQKIPLSSYAVFLRRRIARVYPLHFVMLILVIAFVVAARATGAHSNYGLERFQYYDLPAHFLMMQAWGIFFPGPGFWNPPAWSISIEFLAYLFFPFIVWSIARVSRLDATVPVLLGLAIGFGLNYLTPWGLAGFAGIARGGSEFLLGCLLMNLYSTRFAAWLQGNPGSIAAAALLVACYLLTPDTGFIIAACVAPLLLTLSKDNVVSRVVGWQPVFFLGEISYSIYLGHFLLSSIAYRLVSENWMKTGPLATATGVLLIITFVLACSSALYYFVERPGRELLSGRRRAS
jgi:peptidoglycan/LPS O-acetylase OafA/YrhL